MFGEWITALRFYQLMSYGSYNYAPFFIRVTDGKVFIVARFVGIHVKIEKYNVIFVTQRYFLISIFASIRNIFYSLS